MDTKKEFGLYVKKIRVDKKLSMAEVSAVSGISTSQISRIENGQRGLPKPDAIMQLSKGLKVSYEELMEVAGYFKGVSTEELEGVKSYFTQHEKLDKAIEGYIQLLSDDGELIKTSVFEELEKIVEKYVPIEVLETNDVTYTTSKLKNLIQEMDLSIKEKNEFSLDLEALIKTMQSSTKELQDCIEISNLDNYNVTFNGQILDVNEVRRLKDILVAALNLKN